MAGGFTSLSQVMGLLGGSPIMKSFDVIINKLKAAKTIESGGAGPVISQVGGSMSSLLQNPMAGMASALQNSLTSNKQKLPPSGGGSDLRDKLGTPTTGLQGAMQDVNDAAAALVGLSSSNGFLDTITVLGQLSAFSEDGPEGAYSPETVLKPALMDDEYQVALDEVEAATNDFLSLRVDEAGAIARIQFHIDLFRARLDASNVAIAAADTLAIWSAQVSAVMALLVSGPLSIQQILDKAILPEIRDEIDAINAEYLDTGLPPGEPAGPVDEI